MTDQALFDLALKAMDNAYVPYSHFRVGAAVLSEDGRVFTGCNVENASYGGTICAERTAIVKAVSEGATRFTAVAVAGEDADAWPCGICRQALYEFSPDLEVVMANTRGKALVMKLSELLPVGFRERGLGKKRP